MEMVKNIENFEDIDSIANKYSSSNDIKINPEYKKIVPSLSDRDYDLLKSSIKERGGNEVPIIVNKQNEILDGHHRYRACLELELDPKIEVKEFSDPISEKEFIIDINRNRRQLNAFQISELGYKLEELVKEKSKIRMSEAGKIGSNKRWGLTDTANTSNVKDIGVGSIGPTLSPTSTSSCHLEKGKASEIIAKKINISPTTYYKAKTIIENSSDDEKKRLREGKDKIDKVYRQIQKLKKIQDYNSNDNSYNEFKLDSLVLHCGDLVEKGKEIRSESIDLIFTDPPDSTKDVNIYYELTSLANRVLKPGCSFVTYFGTHNISEILEIAKKNNLNFWWILAVKLNGNTISFHQRKVHVKWKPLLWFVKGEKLSQSSSIVSSNEYIDDFVESKPPEKIFHPWEQSTVEAEYIIKKLTLENQTVLDPMMGSGTTGIAALKLKRKFIGIEKDNNNFLIAKNRLHNISVNRLNNKPVTDFLQNNSTS